MDDDMKRRFERIARAKDSAAKPQRVEAEKQKHQAKTQIQFQKDHIREKRELRAASHEESWASLPGARRHVRLADLPAVCESCLLDVVSHFHSGRVVHLRDCWSSAHVTCSRTNDDGWSFRSRKPWRIAGS